MAAGAWGDVLGAGDAVPGGEGAGTSAGVPVLVGDGNEGAFRLTLLFSFAGGVGLNSSAGVGDN